MRKKINGSSVLITGGAGFIGSHLVDRVIKEGAKEVVIIDNLFCGSVKNLAHCLSDNVHFYNDDCELFSSLQYVFDKHKIDIVFNCATKALNYSFLNPSNSFATNVNIAINLLEFLRQKKYTTLCHFSTSEVYGTAAYEPMDEKHPRNPTTAYAAGKAAADLALESYVRMFDLDAFIVRPFNNYGPRQNYLGILAGIIPITARKVYMGIPPEIHGTGEQSRDFIYVDDTVDAVVKLFDIMQAGDSVNISSDSQVKIKDVIKKICVEMGYAGEILNRPARGSDVFCHNADNSKIKKMINYNLTSFEKGLVNTIAWYVNEFKAVQG